MTAPIRIQRKRTKGWKMPPNTVCVTRPGRWGNQWRIGVNRCTGRGLNYREEPVTDAATSARFFSEMLMEPGRNYPSNDEIVRKLLEIANAPVCEAAT